MVSKEPKSFFGALYKKDGESEGVQISTSMLTDVERMRDSSLVSAVNILDTIKSIQVEETINEIDHRKRFIFRGGSQGQTLFYGSLERTVGTGKGRGFVVKILSPILMEEVLVVTRKKTWVCPICPCEHLTITTPLGQTFARIDSKFWTSWGLNFIARGASKKVVLFLKQAKCCSFGGLEVFQIIDPNAGVVGIILEELFENKSHSFKIQFDTELDVNSKAIVLAVGILFVSVYFY